MLSELIVKHYDKLNKNDLYLCQFISTHKKECSSLTIEELAAMGYEVSEDNPIVLDYPYSAYHEIASNQAVVLKTSIENALNGLVEVALVECQDATENLNAWFNTNSGAEYNYDLGGLGGIGADFGDPETYLDGLLPYGDGFAIRKMGIW